MPRPKYNEDLFQETTMSFGEHLEELRVCLFKAVLGLAIGLFIGLFVGSWVVEFIQTPLSKALTKYYREDTRRKIGRRADELEKQIQAIPEDSKDPEDKAKKERLEAEEAAVAQTEDMAKTENLLAEEIFIHPGQLVAELKEMYPGVLKDLPAPKLAAVLPGQRSNLLRMFIWHRVEDDARIQAKSFNAHEAFMIYLKASLLVGALLSSPWVFYQLWQFVAAGLYPHEKRYVNVYLPFSVGLFFLGASVAFFFVFEPVLTFLFSFNRSLGIDPDPRISEWLSFVLMLPLGFGVAFQLPLVMLFLQRIGLMSVEKYLSYWRVAILIIFVIAAILTPPDPWSMTLLAVPLSILYFGGILLCKFMPQGAPVFQLPGDEEA